MRLITYSYQDRMRIGITVTRNNSNYVLDLNHFQPSLPTDMIGLLTAGDKALTLAKGVADSATQENLLTLTDVTLFAPIPQPGKIICIGHNYDDHIGIGRTEPAEFPNFFCKTANTVIGHQQPIIIPQVTSQVDYEAELAVVIGKTARHITQEKALDYVAGYTIFNDVSARDYQKRTNQWMLGKSFDTFGPMGSALTTADEIPDPHNLELSLTLNNKEMQHTNTRHMIFNIPYMIAYLSEVMTLEVGDVISTGTPAKTDLAKSLPPFMKPGDVVSINIEKVGQLTNPIISEK